MLPTVITDAPEILSKAIAAVKAARAEKIPGVLGIHIEGPFLDKDRKGAHEARFIREMTEADVAQIADCRLRQRHADARPQSRGARLDHVACREGGAGQSRPLRSKLLPKSQAALAAGARAFTHLFNAMSQMNGREPGMVGAALSDLNSFCRTHRRWLPCP